MDHVNYDLLNRFLDDLEASKN